MITPINRLNPNYVRTPNRRITAAFEYVPMGSPPTAPRAIAFAQILNSPNSERERLRKSDQYRSPKFRR